MLASVASVDEARVAVTGGADIVDCKAPEQGALGAVDGAVVAAVRSMLPPRLPLSATIGDVPFASEEAWTRATALTATGVDFVKIGLFPGGGDFAAALTRFAGWRQGRTRLVAVLIAEHGVRLDEVAALGRAGFAGVMIDTRDKRGASLPDLVPPAQLQAFIRAARTSGMFAGLAGALRLAHVPAMSALAPDVLGFRGALCKRGDRVATLDPVAFARIRAALPRAASPALPAVTSASAQEVRT